LSLNVCSNSCLKVWLNGEFSLDLTMSVKSHNKPPKPSPARKRRGKPITTHGKRMIRSAVWWLEQRWGVQNLSFLTCTLPTLPYRKMKLAASKWNEVTRQCKQQLERELKRKGLDSEVVLVTEIQEKRYRESSEVAPHLHIVFRGRKSRGDDWAITKEKAKEIWEGVLTAVLKRKIKAPRGTSIQRVKKSAANYLSKYMSKGGKIVQEIIANDEENLLPTSWWGMTRKLSKRVRNGIRQTKQSTEELLAVLYENRYKLKTDGHLQYFYVVKLERGQKGENESGDSIRDYSMFPGGNDPEFGEVPVVLVGKFTEPKIAEWFL